MKTRNYLLYDVFTTERLAGNPLAVVLDCKGLDTAAMQAIAREFNLSESVFVLPPDNPKHKNRIRIFTPDYEMPFAGHPTVGSAIALADLAGEDGAGIFVLEENIGPVRCAVSRHDGATFAEFDLAKLPEPLKLETASGFGSFQDIVALVGEKRDIKLKNLLETVVRPIRVGPGQIELALEPSAPPGLPGELARKLESWTGSRWIVLVAREGGENPLAVQARDNRDTLFREARAHPDVQAILKRFPGAEIVDVRDPEPAGDEFNSEKDEAP